MATTVKQYIQALRNRQNLIAKQFGSDITGADKPSRVANLALLVLLAVLIKVLVDKGVITDAELTAALDLARDDNWPDEPSYPANPNT